MLVHRVLLSNISDDTEQKVRFAKGSSYSTDDDKLLGAYRHFQTASSSYNISGTIYSGLKPYSLKGAEE